MNKHSVAKVYVDHIAYHIDMPFNYIVPIELLESVFVGARVLVPFGNSNKKVQGLIRELVDISPIKTLKAIYAVIDKEPVLTDELLGVVEFLVANTFCTYYDAVKTVLASNSVLMFAEYNFNAGFDFSTVTLNTNEENLVAFLKRSTTKKQISDLLNFNKSPEKESIVRSLLSKGIITLNQTGKLQSKNIVKMVKLCDNVDVERLKLTQKQREVVLMLNGTAAVKEICYNCGVTLSTINSLMKRGIIEIYDRIDDACTVRLNNKSKINLSDMQEQVYSGIAFNIDSQKANVCLLYGVTGSGKTSVYIKLIEHTISSLKTAIMLVPEISLTPQLVALFTAYFGDLVAVIHSNLSIGERLLEYNRIKDGNASIVIGTRSAIFAPIDNIGVIIIDEEGEQSYKSDKAPRYHAREVAKFRCVTHNATLVLGSATPSIESYYYTQIGRYNLFTLDERYSVSKLPEVFIVDMIDDANSGNLSPISIVLQQAIQRTIDKGEQVILLINRRGYNTVATCMSCGEVIKCDNCDVTMTYHKANGYLMCHYCGKAVKFEKRCPKCGKEYIKLTGLGTQLLEEELQGVIARAKVLRMDTDTTYSKQAFERSFKEFKQGKYNIMIGTQMIAKGLDFPNVTLVGVLSADNGLYSPDFRSPERVFSLLTQVVGRSGRGDKVGSAYIQTLNKDNMIINFAARQDYKSFYDDELQARKLLTYPPFCNICTIGVSGFDEAAVMAACQRTLEIIKYNADSLIPLKVLGPMPADIMKVNNKFKYQLILKCKFNNRFKSFMSKILKLCLKDKAFVKISVYADVI